MVSHPAQLQGYSTFGELLKYLRKRARLTQRELGIATGYSEAHINRMENNHRLPDPGSLKPLFVPALLIEDEPETIARLLALAEQPGGAAPFTNVLAEPDPAQSTAAGVGLDRAGTSAPNRPAAQETAQHTGSLPALLTSFVGREEEIAEIGQHLVRSPARLVTLTGAGGVGKTRLSIKVAEACQPDFPDGVWFVDLTPVTRPDRLAAQITAALAPAVSTADYEQFLIGFLKQKQVLLVLDNCEHLVDACARLAGLLLSTCPGLKLLATSREALNIGSEQIYRVPSLPVPDVHGLLPAAGLVEFAAVQLFVERARAVQPAFALNETSARAVAVICQRLDGIPLAIELAAARGALLSAEEIAARLDRSFQLLTAGSRTALPRHRTLRAAIQWSYDLLDEPERLLLQRLAIFSNGCTLEAAEQVCSGDGLPAEDVLSLLGSLENKSLVAPNQQPGRETRFRLLETVRQFALEQLAANGEESRLRGRHLDYFVWLAEQGEAGLRSSARPIWRRRLKADLENLLAAIEWAFNGRQDIVKGLRLTVAIAFRFVNMLGQGTISWIYLDQGYELAKTQPIPDLLHAWLLFELGYIHQQKYVTTNAVLDQYYEECVALCRKIGPTADPVLALALASWSQVLYLSRSRPDLEAGRRIEAIEVARRLAVVNPWYAALAFLYSAATILVYPEHHDLAYTLLKESVRLFQECGDPWSSKGLQGMAYIEAVRGRPDQALVFLEKQAHLMEGEDITGEIYRSSFLAWVYLQQNDTRQALVTCQKLYPVELDTAHVNISFTQKMVVTILVQESQKCPPQQAQDRLVQAATLWGATTRLYQWEDHFFYVLLVSERFNQAMAIIKERLAADRYAEALAAGEQMTADEAANFVLKLRIE